jgi:bifunctional non-homologous end joining protein LigD
VTARAPLEECKRTLAKLVCGTHPGIALNEHYVGDRDIVYQHACKLGREGIVSKRLGSLNRSGRSKHWVKNQRTGAANLAPFCLSHRYWLITNS